VASHVAAAGATPPVVATRWMYVVPVRRPSGEPGAGVVDTEPDASYVLLTAIQG
jgi:hypothetical protein